MVCVVVVELFTIIIENRSDTTQVEIMLRDGVIKLYSGYIYSVVSFHSNDIANKC